MGITQLAEICLLVAFGLELRTCALPWVSSLLAHLVVYGFTILQYTVN